jgi:hypothetical protein
VVFGLPNLQVINIDMSVDFEMDAAADDFRARPVDDTVCDDPQFQSPSPPPSLTNAGRPKRNYRMPARYNDEPPDMPAAIPLPQPLPPVPPGSFAVPRVLLHVRDSMRTVPNRFGLLREYPHRPSYDPDAFMSPEDLSNYPTSEQTNKSPSSDNDDSHAAPWPFKNMSVYLIMEWMITGSNQKSVGEVDRLADMLRGGVFRPEELVGFRARQENKRMDTSEGNGPDNPYSADGWTESNIHISLPTGLKDASGKGQPFLIPGLHHRSLLAVMKSALTDITSLRFHFSPFKRIWKTASGAEVRCFDEAYTSDAWLLAHDQLQKQPNEPDCKLEKAIIGLMFWSDSTHVANFGTAKVWPLYLYFANLSKYFRGKPSSAASHHIAYIPSVRALFSVDHLSFILICIKI